MRSPHCFVIEPIGERYNNEITIDNKKLIVNSEIYNHEYVNRKAVVISCPLINNTSITKGSEVIVHHNVFRRWLDAKGREKNSKSYFKENTYIVSADQIFLHRAINNSSRFKAGPWKAVEGFSFVQPIRNKSIHLNEQEDPDKGIIRYTDGNTNVGDLVGYTPFSKYEFVVGGERLYRVLNKFITIKYEYQGNEETYNPSWAQSS